MNAVPETDRRHRRLAAGGFAVALVLACGGTAVGATMVTSKTIKDDTIKPVDLDFEIGQDAAALTSPVKLTRDQKKVLATTLSVDDGGGTGIAQAFVELRNPTPNPATVSVLLVHEQDPRKRSIVTATIKVGERVSVPIGLTAQLPAGQHTFKVTAGGQAGIAVETVFLSASATPGS